VLDRILTEARTLTRAEAGSLSIMRDDHLEFAVVQNDLLARRYGEASLRRHFRGQELPFSEPSLAAHAALTGATLNIEDVYANYMLAATFHRGLDEASGYVTRSMLALPLRTPGGEVIGVLQLINAHSAPNVIVPFSEDTEKMMRSFAALAAVAIHRAGLLAGSFRDTLTELYNHQYLTLRVHEEAGHHARFGHPVSVVAMDLDDFRRVNDRAGRVGGDALLREVGALLRRHSRKFTLVGRARSDDFVAVLPNTGTAGAIAYAERIRAVLGAHAFEHGPVTASFGVASLPETLCDPKDLLGAALTSGLDAKRHGGNRIAVMSGSNRADVVSA
jgi:diguanylate cyclase (GGDEF)-like protein